MTNRPQQIYIYDTTLRDGCQMVGINLSLQDKLRIAAVLDQIGVHYIEGGFPASNPKDEEFFRQVGSLKLCNARVSAFGSTRRARNSVENDPGVQALLASETQVVTIVAKAWDLHVNKVLRVRPEENLRMVEDTVRFMKQHGREVLLDAEHFYDGCRSNPEFALKVVTVAAEAGADCVVLCDTNGGSLPEFIGQATRRVVEAIRTSVGVHCHNDSGLAVAGTMAAVAAGAVHVQGTLNGWGERCGNADLCVLLPLIELKTDCTAVGRERLRRLTEVSRFACEAANMLPKPEQPFVGANAFAHKGGLHVDAMLKDNLTYEHVDPGLVGNERRFLVSELSGHAAVQDMARRYNIPLERDVLARIAKRLGETENEGYQFDAAEGSFALLALKEAGLYRKLFDVEGYHVSVMRLAASRTVIDATVKLTVGDTKVHTASEGDGPVNALDGALRKALEPHFENLRSMRLTDYRVRVINAHKATAARVCVVIQSTDDAHNWGTVGVSENIIEASWSALIDSIEYKLLIDERRQR